MNGVTSLPPIAAEDGHAALVRLLNHLAALDYGFVTATPATHQLYLDRRRGSPAASIEDVLGWSMAFRPGDIDPAVEALLQQAGRLELSAGAARSSVRVSRLHGRLFAHSPFPTEAATSVFFGPDSYRFADLIRAELADRAGGAPVIVDLGTGAGVGALVAQDSVPNARVVVTDINPHALCLAAVNARAAGVEVEAHCGDIFAGHSGPSDIVLANPPYILDPARRLYRHGGGLLGAELSVRMAREALQRLRPSGRLILYSGSAIAGGEDQLKRMLTAEAEAANCALRYREIDPDVFGEELRAPAYRGVDRIAAIAAVFDR